MVSTKPHVALIVKKKIQFNTHLMSLLKHGANNQSGDVCMTLFFILLIDLMELIQIVSIFFLSQNDGVPALVTLKKGLVALARQWMKFIVVTQGFKAIGLMRPNQLAKPKEPQHSLGDTNLGLDNGAALQSDTSADGAEFEFDAGGNIRLAMC